MGVSLINGLSYNFSSSSLLIAGVNCPSCTSISYARDQPKEGNKGMSDRDISRGIGAISVTGSVELSLTDIEKIKEVSPGGDILKLRLFEITFLTDNGQSVKKKILSACDFTNDGIDTSEGDQDIKFTLNFVAADVNEV